MLNGRLYRVAFVPFALALAVAAFSLTARPLPLTSTLAPDAFEGAPALAELKSLAAEFPSRRPGSPGDEAARREDRADAGRARRGRARGLSGAHAPLPGADDRRGKDARDGARAARGIERQWRHADRDPRPPRRERGGWVLFEAELSGTAALIELARVFAARETQRTIVLVSTSGGSGGDAGALRLRHERSKRRGPDRRGDRAGDVAGVSERKPFVVPYSDGFGSAPEQLQRTMAGAITQNLGGNPGAPSTIGQLAHLAFPFATGEQGPLNASGLPAVLVQVSGEATPPAEEAVSAGKAGRLRTRGAERRRRAGHRARHRIRPSRRAWCSGGRCWESGRCGCCVATLLMPPLLLLADGYARLRRRRGAGGDRAMIRGLAWTASCALPFLVAAIFAKALGWLGALSPRRRCPCRRARCRSRARP